MDESRQRFPQDIVAIFHASFHPTRGNVIDWSLKTSNDVDLDNLEFNTLPSGLHLVDQDVVYFSKNGHQGVCAFRRVKTAEQGQRGFRLSSLGVLVAKSSRPKPWCHIAALKDLIAMLYSRQELSGSLQPSEADWEPSRRYFEEHKTRDSGIGDEVAWKGWSFELDGTDADHSHSHSNPVLHLPHLLRILGPSTLTLYKHVIGRQRILIYTLPPVEAACILCQVAATFCYEHQVDASGGNFGRVSGKNKEGISVLGMITLSDLDRLQAESQTGRGWIACTTDAIFLEKPAHYDLLIDLTTSTPNKATRPTFHASRPIDQPTSSRGPTHRLSTIRFTWSDVKLWNELDRILQLDTSHSHSGDGCCAPLSPADPLKTKYITAWTDVWRVYEDVCLVCAGLWMGSWRGNSTASYSTANGADNWGSIRLEGDDDLTLNGQIDETYKCHVVVEWQGNVDRDVIVDRLRDRYGQLLASPTPTTPRYSKTPKDCAANLRHPA
uniref:Protein LCHN n=1 Tax=Moniliophthora roreri TaxID=221103 RepID=A0A0W0G5B6_MONRR